MGLEQFGTAVSKNNEELALCHRRVAVDAIQVEASGPHTDLSCTQWTDDGTGAYFFAGPSRGRLPAGLYLPAIMNNRAGVLRKDLVTDDLIDFQDSVVSRVVHEIAGFWGLGERYHRYGFLHRRGYLFYGPQGTGKSAAVQQIIRGIIDQGHLAFFCDDPALTSIILTNLRKIEPERPVVCVFEDIDAIVNRKGEAELLQWLDGADQINKCVNLATTNYPERLDPRIVARPRRFDQLIEVGEVPEPIRRIYLERKLGCDTSSDEIRLLVQRTQGLPFAALAELVIALRCHGMTLDDTIERLFLMQESRPVVTDSRGNFGFSRRSPDGF